MKPRGVIISKGPDRTSMAERPASLYMRTQPSSHLNRGGPDAAADIECLLPNLQLGKVEEFLGRATASWMDYALSKHRHKRVRIHRLDVDFFTRQGGCHLKTSFPPWRSPEGLRPSTPAIRLRAVGHETRPVGECERPCGRTRSR